MTDHAVPAHRAYLEHTLGAHAAYKLHYHLVWSVKARQRLLVGAVAETLRDELLRVAEAAGVTMLTLHVEPEHVHLIMSLRPDMTVSGVVGRLKGAVRTGCDMISRMCRPPTRTHSGTMDISCAHWGTSIPRRQRHTWIGSGSIMMNDRRDGHEEDTKTKRPEGHR
jgi:REP element-mobilizing transposase RayT